ncbi:MAG: phosphate signaling complex protein PhoU [Deltaproteobacteria bacterium]|nr:phosphate signaling complex protein PhoU [Deltaproteobacteria bacterium]
MTEKLLSKQFAAELTAIRQKLLEMGGKVELMIHLAMKGLVNRESSLAEEVIATDPEIDALEIAIDEMCLRVLARQQPVARDLRFITTAMKIVTDLERIGDASSSIAKRALALNAEPPLKPYIDLPHMAELTTTMIKEALDAFVQGDVEQAQKICDDDLQLDEFYNQIQRELLTYMLSDPATIPRALMITQIAKALERIGDHATNLAEMVVFMVKGQDIRHIRKIKKTPESEL